MRTFGYEDPTGVTQRHLQKMSSAPYLTPRKINALARRYQKTGDLEARRELAEHFQQLVISLAVKYAQKYKGADVSTLVSHGNLGLLHAVGKYNPKKAAFATYAARWISAAIHSQFKEDSRTVHVPNSVRRRNVESYALVAKGQSIEEFATPGEDADPNNMAILGVTHQPELNTPLPLEQAFAVAMERHGMSEREADILRMRFLDENRLHEIGNKYGFTRERSRQLVVTGLAKMKRAFADLGFNSISDII